MTKRRDRTAEIDALICRMANEGRTNAEARAAVAAKFKTVLTQDNVRKALKRLESSGALAPYEKRRAIMGKRRSNEIHARLIEARAEAGPRPPRIERTSNRAKRPKGLSRHDGAPQLLEHLANDECAFSVGEQGGRYLFCAHIVETVRDQYGKRCNRPYCAHHCDVSYQPAKPVFLTRRQSHGN